MNPLRFGGHVYVALALAMAAAVLSSRSEDDFRRRVQDLLQVASAEAAITAGAIGETPDDFMPR